MCLDQRRQSARGICPMKLAIPTIKVSLSFLVVDLRFDGWPGSVLCPRDAGDAARPSAPGAEYRPRPPEPRGESPELRVTPPTKRTQWSPTSSRWSRSVPTKRTHRNTYLKNGTQLTHDLLRLGLPLRNLTGNAIPTKRTQWAASRPRLHPDETNPMVWLATSPAS
jgi:hypothetical protein